MAKTKSTFVERDSVYYSDFQRIKILILSKRDNLIENMQDYYRVCHVMNRKIIRKESKVVSALINLFLEIKQKLSESNEQEKILKMSIESLIINKEWNNFSLVLQLCDNLLQWLEDSGLTKISLEKTDWMDDLTTEEDEGE